MLSKKEKYILNVIKYFPIIIILITALTTSYLFLNEHEKHYQKELQQVKDKFIQSQELKIKNEVDKIYEYIDFHKKNNESLIKIYVKEQVNEAYNILNGLYNKYKTTKTKNEIIEMYKASLRKMRFFNNRGYFYVYDMKGNNIFHGLMPFIEGHSMLYHRDITGKEIIKSMINGLKKKTEIYDEWYWHEPNSKEIKRKIGYHKLFKPYNIFVGSGEYVEDFENELKQRIIKYISSIKYINRYITILDYKGNIIIADNKELIGKNIFKKDKKNKEIYEKVFFLAKAGENYTDFDDSTIFNNTKFKHVKLFVKGYNDWHWAIISAFYTDALKNDINSRIILLKQDDHRVLINFALIVGILCLIMIVLSFYITKFLEKSFFSYQKKILKEIKINREKDNMIAQQSKMAAMGEMIANIAHQWRQPLSVISTAVTGLKFEKELGILEDKNFIRGMDSIHESVIHLSKTIDDFRNFFKPNKNKTIFNLKDVVDKTLKLLNSQFNINEIYFVKNIENIKLHGLENELIQVLINILNNSRDELKKVAEDRFIFIDIKRVDDKAKFTIKDTAGGISTNIIKNIFDPYFTTKGEEGTGIGLYMSKQIIENSFKGTIEAKNSTFTYKDKEFRGAEFIMTFDISN
ncbi:histidine kinase [Malaciobacter molluscorum]|uniref:sensor histidine kinase n=1 Tax=Malaciobacter molluscorum TaxID=1032072 RepID=UPI00100AA132|nr:cache domain-containing protein [Malaciobacter molluscorum]RXJ92054.1 histidine kinase [Malaciobacter molluscorum]